MKIIETSLTEVVEFIQNVPEFYKPPDFDETKERCLNKPYLALIAEDQGKRIGCKLGYEENESTFYSWIGGVLPGYRRQGVAQKLLNYQEDWAWRKHYKKIRVKSMNRYPEMLKFLISNRYQIVGLEGSSPETLKVLFEKRRSNKSLE